MPRKPKPVKLTPLERQAYIGFVARYREIDLHAQLSRERVQTDERAFVAALAERAGISVDAIGTEYRVNTDTWTLEVKPTDGQ